MKIQRFIFVGVVAFFIVIGILSSSFYTIERIGTLRFLVSGIHHSVLDLEQDIKKILRENRYDEIQPLLDESSALDEAIAVFSLSLDGKTISVSSAQGWAGRTVEEGYRPIHNLKNGLIDDEQIRYVSTLTYPVGANQKSAYLLIDLDKEFVFGRLNQIAQLYGAALFLVLAFFTLGAFFAVRRWIIRPMEQITEYARTQNHQDVPYFIEEISLLNKTLFDVFHSMKVQQVHLKEALEETRYLDGILRTVADINEFLLTAENIEELLQRSCERLAQHPGYELCHIAMLEDSSLVVRAFSDDSSGCLYPGMKISLQQDAMNHSDPSVKALKKEETVIIDHLESGTSMGTWQFIAEKGQFGSLIALPLVAGLDTPVLGVVTLYVSHSNGFEPKEISMLEELAGDIGFAVESFNQREKLQYHLTTDPVTNLPNRFSLVNALEKEDVSALSIINIDRFSDINEVYGISIGDTILAGYGHWLGRKIDSSDGNRLLYKMGSDEYAVIFKHGTHFSDCVSFLEQLIQLTQKESFMIEGIEIVLTITVGIAPLSEQMLEHATAALKQAKRKRHSLEIFSFSSKEEQEGNIAWYKRIKEAIEESRIVPYFQPIVNNQTGNIIKYEALIRMIGIDGGVITPYLFLEIAKKTKLYPELTKMMIEKVVGVFKTGNIPVSLNLSTQDLINSELADFLETIIRTNGMGRQIIFEILESEGIENYTEVSAFVDRFKAIGCRFAIDDFGSGYSNFDHLLKLNVDTLKIDGALIKILPHDRNAQIFVKHISDFAHEMGISTVAEFVANEEIFKQVREIGIDASQGYYFYEPSPFLVELKQ